MLRRQAGLFSFGVVKDDAQCVSFALAQSTDAMAHLHAIVAPEASYWAVIDRKHHTGSFQEGNYFSARLHAGPLLRHDEFSTLKVPFGLR